MLYRISVTERGLTGIANIFRSRLSRLDDLLGAGTVPLIEHIPRNFSKKMLPGCCNLLLYNHMNNGSYLITVIYDLTTYSTG